MYNEDICCFNPNTREGEIAVENGFSQAIQQPPPQPPPRQQTLVGGSTSNSSLEVEEISEFHLSPQDYHHHHHHQYHNMNTPLLPCDQFNNNNNDLIQQQQQPNWDNGYQDLINMVPTTTTPDLLSLLHLPRYSLPPNHHQHHPLYPNSDNIMSSSSGSVMYDPLFHLNFPHRENSGLLLGVEDHLQMDANGSNGGGGTNNNNMIYYENNDALFENGIFEFNNNGVITRGKGGGRGGSGKSRIFPTERERRVHFTGRFFDLRKLIPNPTKNDRASIVGEAIDYIKELLRTIEEFKMLVEKKRFGKRKSKKRAKGEEDQENQEVDQSCFNKKSNNNNNSTLRCSWLKRRSKATEVDVRIIDDEVTIKVVQKKKINCLLLTAKVLDELKLDLHHVAGGQIGEHYSFLFNTKICEGSCVYASGIADTVMEVVEKHYMEASVPTNGY
ncbi:unnamed protein product [Cochlearia groenlandica]